MPTPRTTYLTTLAMRGEADWDAVMESIYSDADDQRDLERGEPEAERGWCRACRREDLDA